ncbi:ABC transporter ATP-binding protein [Mesobacillus boroniphilus]|uniref:ABC transporter ATP-binding protein n=1 Tax=Mesobacillus boroniphilus TaxID=308892 RepID=A0A944GW61_9BACI|nr:ABC transporter ATP-binding protein [Mesobacillus boroniphilus]MBS8264294.1 ABC transporter ATP-binding protein [Mesobacillus boroniphilus]
MSQNVIELDAVSKHFGDQVVLSNVSMSVKDGDIVGLLGPNGSGKTTMIRLMNGVINQTDGNLSILGLDPGLEGDSVRKATGILTENAGLYHEMSGLDNLIFFSKLYGNFDLKQIHLLMEEFELDEHMHKKVGAYSTGMKRRLGIIKAILHKPKLLFLDEPTNGLDPEGIKLVLKFLKDLNEREGTTIFLCSHILHQLEHVCKEYFFLNDGKITDFGTISELQKRYVSQIKLNVITNLLPSEAHWCGYPVLIKDKNTLQFLLPSSEHITPLLQKIISNFWVHHVEIENNDLESLYFKIRGGVIE